MITVKFADEIARLKTSAEWKSGDRHAVSLVKDDALNVLLMVLKKGAHLHEHHTKGPITVQLVSGSIRFIGGSDTSRTETLLGDNVFSFDWLPDDAVCREPVSVSGLTAYGG